MGDVYLARQETPFKRYVALKVARVGIAGQDVVSRFEAERQILAALDHPNIGRLLDGGTTADGRPYLVMEFVEGLPITQYADEQQFDIPARLSLFRSVCRAVHYAHQNLVVHRDLKPSNVLVTRDGNVKLLDFGIAKLLNPGLSHMAMPETRVDRRMMTPEYASPEQVRGEPLATTSDVYSLGIILYELLSGQRPFEIEGRSTAEILAMVCDEEPVRPSDVAGPAAERHRRQLRGDLDNIVLKAIRKEPVRRYGSAEQLDNDIGRYLDGMPVEARHSTLRYQAAKFMRRHRGAAIAATLVVLSLLGGLSVALWQAHVADQERARTERALAQSEAVSDFLMDLFRSTAPGETSGPDATARELLERGAARADELRDQPDVQAEMLKVLGRVYVDIGQFERAAEVLDREVRLREALYDAGDVTVVDAMNRLGGAMTYAGQYQGAERILRRAATMLDALEARGDETPTDRALTDETRISTLEHLAFMLPYVNQWDEAVATNAEVVRLQKRLRGDNDPLVAGAIERSGAILRALGAYERAEPMLRQAVAVYRDHAPDGSAELGRALFQLGLLLNRMEKTTEAETVFIEAIAMFRHKAGPAEPLISATLLELGETYYLQGNLDLAEDYYLEALDERQRMYGDHPITAGAMRMIGEFYHATGQLAEADSMLTESLERRRELFGDEHQDVAVVMRSLAKLRADQSRFAEADSLVSVAHRMHIRVNGVDHHHVGDALADRAYIAYAAGETRRGDDLLREALALLIRTHNDQHPSVRALRGEMEKRRVTAQSQN